MPLTLVTGRAGCGKTGTVYDALIDSAGKGGSAVLLLPTRADVDRAVSELASRSVTGVRVSRFDSYLEELWGLHGDGRAIAGATQRELLVHRALEKNGKLLDPERSPGMTRLIAAIAASGLRPALRGPVGRELDEVLGAYDLALSAKGLVERSAAHASVARHVPEAVEGTVVANRFTSHSASQLAFLEGAAMSGRNVWVTLTWEESFPPTEALDGLAERLRSLGTEREIGRGSAHFHSPELARLEARLFQRSEPSPSLGHVTLLLSTGDEAEAEAIARRVLAWRAEGIPAERIAVVFRDPVRREAELRAAFGRAGIVADYDFPVPFARTDMGRAFLKMADTVLGDRPAASLSAFLQGSWAGMEPAQAQALDRDWRSARPDGLEDLLAELTEKDRKAAALVRDASDLFAGPVDADSAGSWASLLDRLLSNRCRAASGVSEEAFAAHSAAVRAVEEVAASGESMPGPAFLEALKNTPVSSAGVERSGHVQVLTATRARTRRFDAVVIGGLAGSEFPAPVDEGGAPAGAAMELRRAAEAGGGLAEERLLFYQLVSAARSRLALSRQETDADGTQLPASVFWEEVLDLYRVDDDDRGLPPIERVSLADLAVSPLGTDPRARLRAAAEGEGRSAPPRAREAASRIGARQERLPAVATLGDRRVFSAGEIEAYVQCPYSWFYSRMLRPEGLDAELGPLEAGTLAHATLQTFYSRWKDTTGKTRVEPGDERVAADLIDEVFSAEKSAVRTSGLEEEHELLRLGRQLRGFVQAEAAMLPGFEPRRLEWAFGERDGIDLGGFLLSGRVDRIDGGPEGLVVLDYKRTAGLERCVAKFEKRGLMQIQLYALAARTLLKEPIVGGLYRGYSDGGARGFYLGSTPSLGRLTRTDARSEDEIGELLDAARESARAAVSGMREGRIPAEPACDELCRYCGANGVCARTAGRGASA